MPPVERLTLFLQNIPPRQLTVFTKQLTSVQITEKRTIICDPRRYIAPTENLLCSQTNYLSTMQQHTKERDVMSLTANDLKSIAQLLQPIHNDISELKTDVAGITKRVDSLTDRMDSLSDNMVSLTERVDSLTDRVDSLSGRVDALGEMVLENRNNIISLDSRIREMKLIMENELMRNIRIIAEGHQNLTRKLDKALEIHQDDEMLRLRVNVMEGDVRRIKQHIGIA